MIEQAGPEFLLRLAGALAARMGYSQEAVASAELGRCAERLMRAGMDGEELLGLVQSGAPEVLDQLCGTVAVGETYFFRHAEHFEFLRRHWAPQAAAGGGDHPRVWSAGCATGEEAYSLASFLAQELGAGSFDLLATDLLEKSLEAARKGEYRAWSLRQGSPAMYPVFEKEGGELMKVAPRLKRSVRFARHDLLSGAPAGEAAFDLIFCRNVLVYYSAESAASMLKTLAGCLAEGGLLLLGPMDSGLRPAGLEFCGASGVQAFRKRSEIPALPLQAPKAAPARRPPAPPRSRPAEAPAASTPTLAMEIHLRAIRLVERGDEAGAGKLLAELARLHPAYLPGRLERALWLKRQRRGAEARLEMRRIAEDCEGRDPGEPVEGLMTLPLGYMLASAEAYLGQAQAAP